MDHTEACLAPTGRPGDDRELRLTETPGLRSPGHGNWFVIGDAAEVGDRIPMITQRFGHALALWRDPTGMVRAQEPHSHHAESTREVHVREAHGWIWMWLGPEDARPDEPNYFDSIPRRSRASLSTWVQGTDYLSTIESEVGLVHSRIARARLDTPRTEAPAQVQAPNLWLTRPTRATMMVAAIVPVSRTHTKVYARVHRPRARVPQKGWLFDASVRALSRRLLGPHLHWASLPPDPS